MKTVCRILSFFHLIIIPFLLGCSTVDSRTARECVDPLIGTGFHGHTYPGATVPYGAVQLSPDTRSNEWDACSGYHYSDSSIVGFSHTHLSGTGCIDLGDVLVRPTTESLDALSRLAETDRQKSPCDSIRPVTFSHKNEHAEAGYYSVKLDDGISCELTATAHCGVHRYVFPEGRRAAIVIDLQHVLSTDEVVQDFDVWGDDAHRSVSGYRITDNWTPNQHTHFVCRFSREYSGMSVLGDGKIVMVHFDLPPAPSEEGGAGDTITLEVALSQVDSKGAEANLLAECGKETTNASFDRHRQAAFDLWDKALGRIEVKGPSSLLSGGPRGASRDDRTNFYTALYHTMVVPNLVSDADGRYRRNVDDPDPRYGRHSEGWSGQLSDGERRFSTFSTWDTFRALHPLMTLLDTALVGDVVESMLDMYDAQGELPIWPLASGETKCMIGYHSASIIADAYLKGALSPEIGKKALAAMIHSSNINEKGSDYYTTLGYIPADRKKESVSCLLEYSYDDWCIARMAEAMGTEGPSSPQSGGPRGAAKEYYERAQNYINAFDGQTRFFRGKRYDGNWSEGFNPLEPGRDYTEATAWQYRFGALHDVAGMVGLYGGREVFAAYVDSLFETTAVVDGDLSDITGLVGQYAHGNEPSHHMAYLYNYVGQPWRTQAMTHRLLREMYAPTPEGIIGNEDCGQMSAWYIMTALGLYSVTPGSLEYNLTTPLFDEVVVHLANGKDLTIKAEGAAKKDYIESVSLNGKTIDTNFIRHADLMEGGELVFVLSDKPNTERGTAPEAAPMSLSTVQQASVPYVDHDLFLFIDETDASLGTATEGATIYYTLDGSEPSAAATKYEGPIHLAATTTIKAIAVKENLEPSRVMTVKATKAEWRPAVSAAKTENGVAFKYYEGQFSKVADLAKAAMVEGGTMAEPSLDKARQRDHFGYEFTGFIDCPEKGIYVFSTTSDDGSVLYIDDELVVDNDGSHAAITATGRIPLEAGLHSFRLLYIEDYEGESLTWAWQLPKANKFSPIPTNRLYVR